MKDILSIIALQVAICALVAGAVFMGTKAEARCKPTAPPALKDCRPAPEIGPGAMSCTWPASPPVNPWAPAKRCESR